MADFFFCELSDLSSTITQPQCIILRTHIRRKPGVNNSVQRYPCKPNSKWSSREQPTDKKLPCRWLQRLHRLPTPPVLQVQTAVCYLRALTAMPLPRNKATIMLAGLIGSRRLYNCAAVIYKSHISCSSFLLPSCC